MSKDVIECCRNKQRRFECGAWRGAALAQRDVDNVMNSAFDVLQVRATATQPASREH